MNIELRTPNGIGFLRLLIQGATIAIAIVSITVWLGERLSILETNQQMVIKRLDSLDRQMESLRWETEHGSRP